MIILNLWNWEFNTNLSNVENDSLAMFWLAGREVLELDCIVELELSDYRGNRLSPQKKNSLVDLYSGRNRLPREVSLLDFKNFLNIYFVLKVVIAVLTRSDCALCSKPCAQFSSNFFRLVRYISAEASDEPILKCSYGHPFWVSGGPHQEYYFFK